MGAPEFSVQKVSGAGQAPFLLGVSCRLPREARRVLLPCSARRPAAAPGGSAIINARRASLTPRKGGHRAGRREQIFWQGQAGRVERAHLRGGVRSTRRVRRVLAAAPRADLREHGVVQHGPKSSLRPTVRWAGPFLAKGQEGEKSPSMKRSPSTAGRSRRDTSGGVALAGRTAPHRTPRWADCERWPSRKLRKWLAEAGRKSTFRWSFTSNACSGNACDGSQQGIEQAAQGDAVRQDH